MRHRGPGSRGSSWNCCIRHRGDGCWSCCMKHGHSSRSCCIRHRGDGCWSCCLKHRHSSWSCCMRHRGHGSWSSCMKHGRSSWCCCMRHWGHGSWNWCVRHRGPGSRGSSSWSCCMRHRGHGHRSCCCSRSRVHCSWSCCRSCCVSRVHRSWGRRRGHSWSWSSCRGLHGDLAQVLPQMIAHAADIIQPPPHRQRRELSLSPTLSLFPFTGFTGNMLDLRAYGLGNIDKSPRLKHPASWSCTRALFYSQLMCSLGCFDTQVLLM